MPLYGTPQAGNYKTLGKNLTSVIPGESITLLNGTETITSGTSSVAFMRGSGSIPDNGQATFNVSGCPNSSTIAVQVAGADVDGQYTTVTTITPDTNGNGAYTDVGISPFMRVKVATFVSGDAPVVTVQR